MNLFPLHPPDDFRPAPPAQDDRTSGGPPDVAQLVAAIVRSINRHRYRFDTEKELQGALEAVLVDAGLTCVRELALTPEDVIDFLVADCVGVEVKVRGSLSAVTRQLHRYAGHEAIKALVLVTARRTLANQPAVMQGKPLEVVVVSGAFL